MYKKDLDTVETMKLEEERRKKFISKIIYSTEYMDWLCEFTKKEGYSSFSDQSFKYGNINNISDFDKRNIKDLPILFDLIMDYSKDNYIYPIKVNYGMYYVISYKDNYFKIGVDCGQGTRFYCIKTDEKINDALDYSHIMSSVKLPSTIIIDYKLEKLDNLIEELYLDDVPLKSIEEETYKILEKIKKRKNVS